MENHTDPDGVGPTDAPEPEAAAVPEPAAPGQAATDAAEPTGEAGSPPDTAGQQAPAPPTGGPTAAPPTGNPPPPGEPPRPATGDGFFGAVRRTGIVRTDDRWIGGVCSGLAQRFGLDPLLVRGIFAATVLVAGFGLVAYGVAWALLPEARDGRIHLQETVAGRFDSAVLGALGMVFLGLIRGDSWLWWGHVPDLFQGLAWMGFLAAVVTIVVMVIVAKSSGRQEPRPPAGPWAGPVPAPPQPASTTAAYPTANYPTATHPTAPAFQGTSTPNAAPTAYAPQWTPPAPVVTQRRPGPGPTAVGVVVALTLIITAGLLLANRSSGLDAPVALLSAGVCVALAGLGIVVSGLRGRRSGVLGFLAIVTVLFAGPWAVYEAGDWSHHRSASIITFDDADSARAGVDQGVGDVVVDLRNINLTSDTATPEPTVGPDQTTPDPDTGTVPPDVGAAPEVPAPPTVDDAAQTVRVPVNVGAGDVRILLPDGVNTRVEVEVGAGRVTWQIDEPQTLNGLSLERTFQTDRDADGPELVVHVSIGVGNLTVSQKGDL